MFLKFWHPASLKGTCFEGHKTWIKSIKNLSAKGEKPGLVVRAGGSRPRGCGFESHNILDGCSDASLAITLQWKRNKVSQMGTNIFKKIYLPLIGTICHGLPL